MKTLKYLIIIGIISFGLYSFDQILQEEWKIPDKYIKMKNPTYVDKDNLELGKALFSKHCKSVTICLRHKIRHINHWRKYH